MAAAEQPTAAVPHRVLLVREWDEQVGGSGCCGRLSGENSEVGSTGDFARARESMVAMGEVYRALRREMPDVELTVVDPRNTVWLLPTLVRDARRRGLGWVDVVRQVRWATGASAIVVDGMVVCRGRVPDVDDALLHVRAALAQSSR